MTKITVKGDNADKDMAKALYFLMANILFSICGILVEHVCVFAAHALWIVGLVLFMMTFVFIARYYWKKRHHKEIKEPALLLDKQPDANHHLFCPDQLFYQDGKVGLKAPDGFVMVPATHDDIVTTAYSAAGDKTIPTIIIDNGKYGLVSSDGQDSLLLKCDYDDIKLFDAFWVRRDGKLGYVDLTAKTVLPCIIDELHLLTGSTMLYFKASDKMGIISKKMPDGHSRLFDEVIVPVFPADDFYHCEFVRCRLDGQLGYITRSGEFSEYGDYESCITVSKGPRF